MIQVIDVKLRSEERKEKRIEERKKEILQVAMTLYTNKKVSDITMQDIGKGVSFSRASMLRLLSSDWLGLRTGSTEAELVLFYHHWSMAWDSLRQCFKRFMPSMKTAHMTQHPLSIFDAAYMGIDKILPK